MNYCDIKQISAYYLLAYRYVASRLGCAYMYFSWLLISLPPPHLLQVFDALFKVFFLSLVWSICIAVVRWLLIFCCWYGNKFGLYIYWSKICETVHVNCFFFFKEGHKFFPDSVRYTRICLVLHSISSDIKLSENWLTWAIVTIKISLIIQLKDRSPPPPNKKHTKQGVEGF